MRSYDNPQLMSVHFAAIDFGDSGNDVRVLALPDDARDTGDTGRFRGGRVVGALIHNITEDFLGDSSDAGILVGTAGNTDLYFETGLVLDETVDVGESVWLVGDGTAIDIPESAAGFITVTFIACVGGALTGIADVELYIDLF